MSLMKTFTKGGQVTLHNVRMLRQVLNVTLVMTLLLGGLCWGLKTWTDFTPHQRYVITQYYMAEFNTWFSTSEKSKATQRFVYENGYSAIVRSRDILTNFGVLRTIHKFKAKAIQNAYLTLLMGGVIFLLICGFWVWRGNVKRGKEIISGSEIVEPEVLQRMLKRQKIASPFQLGGVSLRLDSETQHMMFCGTTGTGKSNCFTYLFPQIRAKKQRAIVVDTTGEFVAKFYREGKDFLMNPFDERSVGWNPWVDCQTPYHYDELAQAFVPQTGNDSFWSESARTLFSEAMAHLSREDCEDVDELINLLLKAPLKELYDALKDSPAASLVDPAGDRTAMSIRSHLSPYLKPLRYLSDDKDPFSVRDWVLLGDKNKSDPEEIDDSWLFIVATPDQRETLRPLMTGLMSIAINSLMSSLPDRDRRLWFIIDELISLNKQETLSKALAEIRKYGGCIAVGIQNIPQLQDKYGSAETKSITSLFNTKIIFRNGDPETARHMSQMLGEQEVKEAVEGISYGAHQMRDGVSLNEQKKMKPVVSINDIMILNDLEAYIKLPGNLPVTKLKFEVNRVEKVCPAFMPVQVGEEEEEGDEKSEERGVEEWTDDQGDG